MKWVEDIKNALEELGGEGHLSEIYKIVMRNRMGSGNTIGELEAWVRHNIYNNSRGKGEDIFEPVYPITKKRGVWRLKR